MLASPNCRALSSRACSACVPYLCRRNASKMTILKFAVWHIFRQGSNALDSSSATERSSSVMLSAAKHLAAHHDRPFAEFTLSEANVLRVTLFDCSNFQGLFFTIETQ